jgi:hypothetical protein
MIKAGCFPCSSEKEDLKYTDYEDAFINCDLSVEQAKMKIQNLKNTILDPMRRLRTGD